MERVKKGIKWGEKMVCKTSAFTQCSLIRVKKLWLQGAQILHLLAFVVVVAINLPSLPQQTWQIRIMYYSYSYYAYLCIAHSHGRGEEIHVILFSFGIHVNQCFYILLNLRILKYERTQLSINHRILLKLTSVFHLSDHLSFYQQNARYRH